MAGTDNLKPWPKGVSGNPGGRPKGIARKAREHTDKAVEVLVNGMDDEDPRVRVAAAREILDRGYGKPLTMTADLSDKLENWDDESIDSAIAILRDAIGNAGEAGDGEESPAVTH